MPNYELNLSSEQIDRSISGSNLFFIDPWGFTGDVNLKGTAKFDAANIIDVGVENDLHTTGDSIVYGNLTGFNNNYLANLNVTGNAFVSNFTGQTNFNKLIATGSYSEISQIRGGLNISGENAVVGSISNLGSNYLIGNHYQTGEHHVNGDVYQTGTSRITGALYVNGIQITGGAVGGGSSISLTGNLFSAFTEKGQLIVGSGNGTGSFLNTGAAQSGYKLVINSSTDIGLEWRQDSNSSLEYLEESYFLNSTKYHGGLKLNTSTNANTSVYLSPRGNGGFYVGQSGSANNIGEYSVDLQLQTNSNKTVAGNYSTIAGGRNSNLNSDFSFSFGDANDVDADSHYSFIGGNRNVLQTATRARVFGEDNDINASNNAIIFGNSNSSAGGNFNCIFGDFHQSVESYNTSIGRFSKATRYGEIVHAAGSFNSNKGTAQSAELVSRRTTSNNSQTELFLDGASKRIAIESNCSATFVSYISARRTDAGGEESASYEIKGQIKNDGGTTTLTAAITKTVLGEDDATWDATIEADNTNDALVIKVTGATGKTINWVASTRLCESKG